MPLEHMIQSLIFTYRLDWKLNHDESKFIVVIIAIVNDLHVHHRFHPHHHYQNKSRHKIVIYLNSLLRCYI